MTTAAQSTTIGALQLEQGMGFAGAFFLDSAMDLIVANAGGGKANGTPLRQQNNRVTTVATSGDSVLLPPALPGLDMIVVNHGANPMQVYGQGSDTINDVSTTTGVSQMANSTVLFMCMTAGAWYTEGLASGFSSGLQTFAPQPNVTAHAGGGQASATPISGMTAFLSTVVTAADSVILAALEARDGDHDRQSDS